MELSPERRAQAVDDLRYHHMMGILKHHIDNLFEGETKRFLIEVIKPRMEAAAPTHGVSFTELEE